MNYFGFCRFIRYRIFFLMYRWGNQNYANFVEVFSQNVENTVWFRKKYYLFKKNTAFYRESIFLSSYIRIV